MKSSEYFNLDTLLNQDDFELISYNIGYPSGKNNISWNSIYELTELNQNIELIDVVSKKTRLIKHCLEKAEEYHKFINRPIIPEDKVDISVLLINYDF